MKVHWTQSKNFENKIKNILNELLWQICRVQFYIYLCHSYIVCLGNVLNYVSTEFRFCPVNLYVFQRTY